MERHKSDKTYQKSEKTICMQCMNRRSRMGTNMHNYVNEIFSYNLNVTKGFYTQPLHHHLQVFLSLPNKIIVMTVSAAIV